MRANPMNALSSSSPFGIHCKAMNRYFVAFILASLFIFFPFSPAYAKGKVSIKSTPSNARVTIDGEFRGKTPMVLRLDPGRHRLKLKKKGSQCLS